MEVFAIIGAIIICGLIVKITEWWENRKEEKEKEQASSLNQDAAVQQTMTESTDKSKSNMEQSIGTRDLLLQILKKVGCQYEADEDDRICFMWQGGHFIADAANDCMFVVVWYQFWAEYELYDIDTISRVKRVINETNINYNIDVVYSANEAGSTFHVHSKKHFLFIPQIPNLEDYLQAVLGQFFSVRRYMETELDKLKNEEERYNTFPRTKNSGED